MIDTAAATSVALLRETGTPDRAGDRAALRLADAHALFGGDMRIVERELLTATSDGAEPATKSATHLLEAGGKRVRPLATLLAAACFGGTNDAAREAAVSAELVHLATLLHDDVIDDGQERRGLPTSRRLWGNAVSVLAGDLLLTHALERTATALPSAMGDLVTTLRKLVDGEVVQLRGRTALDVSEATYFAIVEGKTASLFAWAARAGGRAGGAPANAIASLGEYGRRVGIAFQLVDDILDYVGDARATGKAVFADLREGKVTLPLARAVAIDPALATEIELARGGDDVAADRLARAVVSSGACDSVRARAIDETRAALTALASSAPPSVARDLLACVAEDLAARAS